MTSTLLNEEALAKAKDAFDHAMGIDRDDHQEPWYMQAPVEYRNIGVEPAISAYLSADTVNSVPGVYDLGAPEPDGLDQVVECDELGHPYARLWGEDEDFTWSKTTDGKRWKGHKGGKVYLEWPELVRRHGPVMEVSPEASDAT